MNDKADFISIERSDDREAIGNALTVSSSFDFAGRLDHFSAEDNAFRPGLRSGVTSSVIGQITCCQAVADDNKSTVLADPDVLVAIRSARLQKVGIVGMVYIVSNRLLSIIAFICWKSVIGWIFCDFPAWGVHTMIKTDNKVAKK